MNITAHPRTRMTLNNIGSTYMKTILYFIPLGSTVQILKIQLCRNNVIAITLPFYCKGRNLISVNFLQILLDSSCISSFTHLKVQPHEFIWSSTSHWISLKNCRWPKFKFCGCILNRNKIWKQNEDWGWTKDYKFTCSCQYLNLVERSKEAAGAKELLFSCSMQ